MVAKAKKRTRKNVAAPKSVAPSHVILPDDHPYRDLLIAVASMPGTTPLVEQAAWTLQRNIDEVWAEMLLAEVDGLLTTMPDDDLGPVCCLTALSAGRLRLRLSSDSLSWIAPGQADHSEDFDARDVLQPDDPDMPDLWKSMADPGPGPDEACIATEELEAQARRLDALPADHFDAPVILPIKARRRKKGEPITLEFSGGPVVSELAASESLGEDVQFRIPRPTSLLGSGTIWPIWTEDKAGNRVPWTEGLSCPICSGRTLKPRDFCLCCTRSGMDGLIDLLRKGDPTFAAPRPTPDPKPVPLRQGLRLRGGCGV